MRRIIFLLMLFLNTLGAVETYAQYKVGDYFVNGQIKGIVFFVDENEGTIAILKTDMDGRFETFGIGDVMQWADKDFIVQNANNGFPYDVWDIPSKRMARLINQNFEVVRETARNLGYKGLPPTAFCDGRVSSDGVQRLIPIFIPKYRGEGDIFDYESEAALFQYGAGVLLYGIVDYTTGTMKKIEY